MISLKTAERGFASLDNASTAASTSIGIISVHGRKELCCQYNALTFAFQRFANNSLCCPLPASIIERLSVEVGRVNKVDASGERTVDKFD